MADDSKEFLNKLIAFIERLKNNQNVVSYDKAAIKQAIILPTLNILGWDITNVLDEVIPEYSIGGKTIDFYLKGGSNDIMIEVRKPLDEFERYQEQFLKYSYQQNVELAVLTNGLNWSIFIPRKKDKWETKCFYSIDIITQNPSDVAFRLFEFLSKPEVSSGNAIKKLESIYEDLNKNIIIEKTILEAWNLIISQPDDLVVDLLIETTNKLCGLKPEPSQIEKFLKKYTDRLQIIIQDNFSGMEIKRHIERKKKTNSEIQTVKKNITEDLIPHILQAIMNHGGRASKDTVENELYEKFEDIFSQSWYQGLVSNNVPRWKHNIDWARNKARERGLIKRPEESGYGFWEISEVGKKYILSYKG